MKKVFMLMLGITLALGMLFTPLMVRAAPFLDFNIDANNPVGAQISFAGTTSDPLKGVKIGVDSVTGKGTPLKNNVQVNLHSVAAPDGAILTFTTGNFTGAGTDDWLFAGGGSISIDLPISGGSLNLLAGEFTAAEVDKIGSSTFKVAISGFTDFKNTRLLNFYGLPTGIPYTGDFNISFLATGNPPGAFTSSSLLSGDVFNSVPEPATMLLLGSGLLGMGFFARRRFKK
jgi:hypothetical protein